MSGRSAAALARVRPLLAALLLLPIAVGVPAAAAELRVLCPGVLRAPVLEAARAFARSGEHRIELVFADLGAIHKRVASGEPADVVIGSARGVDALLRLGIALEGSDAALARTVLALALPAGARAAEVSDAGALASLLRAADSLVYPDAALGAAGGGAVAELLERLGVRAEVEARSRRVADAREVAKRVAAGAAQAGIAYMSDIVGVPGVVAVGPLGDPPAHALHYAAVVMRRSALPEAARSFVRFLGAAEARAAFRAAGYVPQPQAP